MVDKATSSCLLETQQDVSERLLYHEAMRKQHPKGHVRGDNKQNREAEKRQESEDKETEE